MARNLLDDYMNQPKRQGNKNLLDEYIKMSTPKLDTTAYTNMLNTLLNSSAVTGNGYQTPAVMASAANTARKAQQIAEKYGIGDSSYRQYLDSVASGVQGKQEFMSQFTGKQDYNQRYAYPQTVKGKTDAEIEAMIGAVPKAQNLLNRAAAFGKGTGAENDDAYLTWLNNYFKNNTATGIDRQIADNQSLLDANKAKQEEINGRVYDGHNTPEINAARVAADYWANLKPADSMIRADKADQVKYNTQAQIYDVYVKSMTGAPMTDEEQRLFDAYVSNNSVWQEQQKRMNTNLSAQKDTQQRISDSQYKQGVYSDQMNTSYADFVGILRDNNSPLMINLNRAGEELGKANAALESFDTEHDAFIASQPEVSETGDMSRVWADMDYTADNQGGYNQLVADRDSKQAAFDAAVAAIEDAYNGYIGAAMNGVDASAMDRVEAAGLLGELQNQQAGIRDQQYAAAMPSAPERPGSRVDTFEQERKKQQGLAELRLDNLLSTSVGDWQAKNSQELYELENEQLGLEIQDAILKAQREEVVAGSKYAELAQSPDFEQLAAYDSSNGDSLYKYINTKGTSKEQGAAPVFGMGEFASAVDVSKANNEAAYQAAGYSFLLPEEVQAYNYIYKKDGAGAAHAFLDSFQNIRYFRARSKESEEWAKYADEHGVWASVVSLGTKFTSSMMYPIQLADAALNPDHSQFSNLYSGNYITNAIRSTVGQNIDEQFAEWAGNPDGEYPQFMGENLGSGLYNMIMSWGDMGVALAAGNGVSALGGSANLAKGMTQYIMGSQAGSDTLLKNISDGMPKERAITMAVASSMIESLTEKYSIDAIWADPKRATGFIAKNLVTEGSEEAASNIANTLVDLILNADHAELSKAIAKDGYEKAMNAYIQSVGLDALMGAISGAVMSGGKVAGSAALNTAHNVSNTIMTGKQINTNQTYKQLHDIAVAMPEGSKARKIAQGNDKLNNRKAGQLYNALMEELDAKSQTSVRKSMVTDIKGRLQELGAQGDTTQVAEAIQKAWMGEKLSARESDLIAQNKLAMQVQHELLDLEEGWAEKAHETASKQRRETLTQMLDVERLASKGYKPAQDDAAAKAIAKNASTTYANADQEKGLNTTAYTKEGTTVEIKRIEEQDGKAVYLVEKDGQDVTYAINDLELDSINTETLVQPLKRGKMSVQAANTMMQLYATSGLSAPLYAKGFTVAYNAGVQRIGMAYVNNNSYSKALSPEVRKAAFDAGMADTKDEAPSMTKRKGRVTVDKSIDKANLTDNQKASIRAMEKIAKALHIDIEFFASKADATGSYAAYENGSFRDGVMRLDINAGRDKSTDVTEFAILRTASHELTHYIAEASPQMYLELQAFVVDHLLEKGESLQTLMDRKKARENRAMSDEAALEEVIADACEMMLKDSTAIETLARENATLFEKMADWLRDFFDKIREAFAGVEAVHAEARALMEADADGVMHYIDGLQALWDKALVDAARAENGANSQEDAKESHDNVRYSPREAADDTEDLSIKEQIRANLDKINAMQPVANVVVPADVLKDKKKLNQWAIDSLYDFGFKVDRQEFGIIEFSEKEIGNSLRYTNEPSEKAAFAALPRVLKRGIEIGGHDNHKYRGFGTITFAAPVTINGTTGNMAVVVKLMEKNRYKTHRILMPDGSRFVFDTKNNAEPTTAGGVAVSGSYARHISSAVDNSMHQPEEKVNRKFSVREGMTVKQYDAEYSRLYDEYRAAQTEAQKAKQAYDEAANAPELFEAMMALIDNKGRRFSPEGKEERRHLKAALKEVEERLGLAQLKTQMDNADDRVKDLRKQMDDVQGAMSELKERDTIAKSGLSEGDYFRKQAVKEFGYTSTFVDAGYLLPNGKMLNFSGEKGKHFGTRGQDHRAIGVIFENTHGSDAMTRFMNSGNIRIMGESPGLDISSTAEPTAEQYAKIKSMVREYAEKRRFNVDISDENGRVIGSLFYEGKVNADKVANDIKHYFATGEIREQSALDAFRYQARDADTISSREALANALETAAKNDLERGLLADYKKIIQSLNEDQEKLAGHQKIIRELSFKKGGLSQQEKDELTKAKNRAEIVRNRLNRNDKKLLNLEATEALKAVVARERVVAERKIRKEKDKQLAEYRERTRDTLTRSALRDRIKHDVKALNRLLLNETDTKHVPEELKGAVAQFLTVFTQDSSVFEKGKLDDLRVAYEKINDRANANEDLPELPAGYNEGMADLMTDLRANIDNHRLSELTEEETRNVLDIVQHLLHVVRNSNRLFFDQRSESLSANGKEFIEETDKKGKYKGNDKNYLRTLLTKDMVTPAHFFKSLGGVGKKLFDDLKAGESKYGLRSAQAQNYFEATAKKYNYDKWRNVKGDVLAMTTEEGHKITLTREQALGLYAVWNREISDNGQNAKHLSEGGFVYEDAMTQDKKSGDVSIDTSDPNKMSKADMDKVAAWLTDEQRAFAKEMVRYLSQDMARLGNEVSMTLFGIRKYTESSYYPYQTSKNWRFTTLGQGAATSDQRLKHWSATHRVKQHAGNPIIASDFTTVWFGHVNQMILYSSMCVPLENLNRVYNYQYTDEDNKKHSVKQSLQNAYGRKAMEYIEQLSTDLNGGVRTQGTGIMSKLVGKFKRNAVMLSMSVVVQQPSAIVRATALVNPKYFAKGIMKDGSWEELKKYSGIAVIKEMGGFDTNTGLSAQAWIGGNRADTLKEKVSNTLDKAGGFLPERADRLAWVAIWRAVKAEVADTTNLTGEELLQAAAKRFDEVISYTQVYDSVLSKSQMMRNHALDAVTSFMSEPTLTYNMLLDAFTNRGKSDSVNPARAVAVFLSTALVNSLLKALETAARDDEDKNYWEKYIGKAAEGFIEDINPLNLIPYARDIWSISQGFDVERPDMSLISDLFNGYKRAQKAISEDGDLVTGIKEIAAPVGAFLGVPVKNVWRDTEAIYRVMDELWNSLILGNGKPITKNGVTYSILEALPFYGSAPTDYYSRRLDAMLEGDASELESLTMHLETGLGKSEKTIKTQTKTQLGKRYKAGKISDTDATDILMDYFEMDADEAYWQLKEWREKKAHKDEDDYSFSRTDDLKEALLSGKTAQIEAAKTELAGVGGYTDKEVVSEAKSAIKSLYVDGQITLDKAMKLLQDQAGDMTQDDLYWTEQEWAYEKANPDGEWNKFMGAHAAIESGKGAKQAAKELLTHGVEKGDAARAIATRWKATYVSLYNTDRKAALDLHSRILDMYVALGYSRSYQIKYIKDHWFE